MSRLLEYAKHVAKLVDKIILDNVRGTPKPLYDASLHLLRAGGKRLRPLMVILACRVAGGDENLALYAASAVELLHNFTLVHDDIMDHDEFRRGIPTVHKVWGEPLAILAGDLLFSKSFELMLKSVDVGVPLDRVLRCVDYLAWAASTIAEGQALDMSFEERAEVSEDEYITMVEKKTSALFQASLAIGGIIGGGAEGLISKLKMYGRFLGIAFQIQDDILGVVGDEKTLGKPVGSDIREGKKTLIIIHALRNASYEEKQNILRVLGRRDATRDEIEEVIRLLKRLNSIDYAKCKAKEYAEKALAILSEIQSEDMEAIKMLEELTRYVVLREH